LPTVDELVTLDIPARAEYVVLGRLALSGVLRERGFSADAIADLKLALTEACSNSVRHAYNGESGQVHLCFNVLDDRVVVEIRDEGAGFCENGDCDAEDAAPPELSEGGMGISIIRAVVDEFSLDRPVEGGTLLRLTKLRDA
jgi:serine/threonine-protein kinase RsbW